MQVKYEHTHEMIDRSAVGYTHPHKHTHYPPIPLTPHTFQYPLHSEACSLTGSFSVFWLVPLMRPEEVNERAPQPFIPITIVRLYSGRETDRQGCNWNESPTVAQCRRGRTLTVCGLLDVCVGAAHVRYFRLKYRKPLGVWLGAALSQFIRSFISTHDCRNSSDLVFFRVSLSGWHLCRNRFSFFVDK